jgi:hypothetical protein
MTGSSQRTTVIFAAGLFLLTLAFPAKAFSEEEKAVPKEASSDTNKDGKPDTWQYFDAAGNVSKAEADTDFDGKIDQTAFYEGGKLVRVERDTDHDGKPDTWVKY